MLFRLQELVAAALADTPWEAWADGWLTAQASLTPLSRANEWLLVLLGLMSPMFVAFTVVPPGWRRIVLAAGAAALGFAATTLSTTAAGLSMDSGAEA